MGVGCGTKGPDMKEKGGDDEDDVTPAPANSDPVDDEVMHLAGYEIGSKRILAEIEEHAFADPPAAPRPSRPFTVSAEVRRPTAAPERPPTPVRRIGCASRREKGGE